MKSRAAVAFAPGKPLEIVEIDVAPPKKGEVLIKVTHTGVCHTGNDSNLLIVFYVQIMPDDFVMQLHRF